MNAVLVAYCPVCDQEIHIEQTTEEVKDLHSDIISCPNCNEIIIYEIYIIVMKYEKE